MNLKFIFLLALSLGSAWSVQGLQVDRDEGAQRTLERSKRCSGITKFLGRCQSHQASITTQTGTFPLSAFSGQPPSSFTTLYGTFGTQCCIEYNKRCEILEEFFRNTVGPGAMYKYYLVGDSTIIDLSHELYIKIFQFIVHQGTVPPTTASPIPPTPTDPPPTTTTTSPLLPTTTTTTTAIPTTTEQIISLPPEPLTDVIATPEVFPPTTPEMASDGLEDLKIASLVGGLAAILTILLFIFIILIIRSIIAQRHRMRLRDYELTKGTHEAATYKEPYGYPSYV